jgi:hypothetical protein
VRDSAGISTNLGTGKMRCAACNGFGCFLCERCKAVRIVYLQKSPSAIVKQDGCWYYKEMTPNHEFDPYADPDFKKVSGGNRNVIVGSKVIGGTIPCCACAAKRGDKSIRIEATKERITAVEALLRRESVSLAAEEMFCGRMRLVGAAQPDPDIMSSKAVVWHADKWLTVEEKAAVVKGVEPFQWPPKKGRELDVRDIREKAVELQISANAIPEGMQELARIRAATQDIPQSKAAMNELKFRRTTFLRDDVKATDAVCVFRIDAATRRIQLIMRRKDTDRAVFLTLLEPESVSAAFEVPDDAGVDSLKTGGELVVYYAVAGNSASFGSQSRPWVVADAARCYFLLIEIRNGATREVLRSWRP